MGSNAYITFLEKLTHMNASVQKLSFHLLYLKKSTNASKYIITNQTSIQIVLTRCTGRLNRLCLPGVFKPFGLHVLRATSCIQMSRAVGSSSRVGRPFGHNVICNLLAFARYAREKFFTLSLAIKKLS